ncbi:hypothetical protein [Streptomyces lincolnensis]|nr:hypothetical protein [Streptomyces lincolnensis]
MRDDGRGGTRLPPTALGGELRTGPRADRRGWEVMAILPTEKTSS